MVALLPPLLWSLSNHFDKYLISKYFKGGAGAINIFTAFFALVTALVVYVVNPSVATIAPRDALVLILVGVIGIIELTIYCHVLNKDETSIVTPMFQLIPVLTYLLSFIMLGEVLTQKQIFASVVIILGAIILSINLSESKIKFRGYVLGMMIIASFLVALISVLFKLVALEEGYWPSTFWSSLGAALVGVFYLLFIKPYRQQFVLSLKNNKKGVLAFNSINEIIDKVANLIMNYALLLAPVTLVWVVNGFQPLFVLIFGVILTLLFPNIIQESLLKKHLIQKITAIGIILIGTLLLNF